MKRIYLDYAASTPLEKEVEDAMGPYLRGDFANAHAVHEEGRTARKAIEHARTIIANALSVKEDELIFTASGTESNSLAIQGVLLKLFFEKGNFDGAHIITSAIEHPSVLECFKDMESHGAKTSYIGIDAEGILNLEELERALDEKTVFVSIMYANNEIGTLQPIKEIAKLIRRKSPRAVFHTDASQGPLFEVLNCKDLDVDLLSIDAQKLYGPKGVGALYIRRGITLRPLFIGGKQESGIRPGTVNTPGVVGFGKAYEITERKREEDRKNIGELRDYFFEQVTERLPHVYINGSRSLRLANNANFSFPGIEGEYMVAALDEKGIAAATRSACLAGGGEGSYVVAALDRSRAKNAVRFTLGRETTRDEIDRTVETLVEIVERFQKQ